ncbi:hypothetical protein [uncultured Friedmanniella sp.]|uniref:sunset domain-containing protein n=1 Tax=uncultured Friedmanniella sp. TaxID=335381 RepID=UPI0035CC1BCA
MKRKTRVDAAPSRLPVAELAQSAGDRIVPLAQGAAARAVPFAQGAAAKAVPLAHTAAERVAPLANQAVSFAAPYAQQAVDAVTPYAQQAADAVSPYAHTVADKVGPYAERLAPLAAGGALAAHEAAERIGPAVEAVKEKVSDELLPRVSTALTAAAASPIAVEASRRGRAAYAAARGELSLPEVEEKKGGSWVKRLAVVAAVAGVVALVARRFLGGSKDSGWQAARPSAPYVPAAPAPTPAPTSTADADAAAVATEDLASVEVTDVDESGDLAAETTPDVATESTEVTEDAASDDTVLADPEPTPEISETPSPYGPGSYIGTEPPEGFSIKGNENSMKFHLPGGRGYNQTIAEVWFDSEEAAESAGFVRAQH